MIQSASPFVAPILKRNGNSSNQRKMMSIFPNEDNLLTKEIESWKGFADSLNSQGYKELFNKMLNDCYQYAAAINTKIQPFPTEPLITAVLLSQHKMID